MLFADPVPEMGSHQVRDSWEGIFNHFDPSLGDEVISDEGVVEMTPLDNFFVREIDEDKLVENQFSHVKVSTVGNDHASVMG